MIVKPTDMTLRRRIAKTFTAGDEGGPERRLRHARTAERRDLLDQRRAERSRSARDRVRCDDGEADLVDRHGDGRQGHAAVRSRDARRRVPARDPRRAERTKGTRRRCRTSSLVRHRHAGVPGVLDRSSSAAEPGRAAAQVQDRAAASSRSAFATKARSSCARKNRRTPRTSPTCRSRCTHRSLLFDQRHATHRRRSTRRPARTTTRTPRRCASASR